MDMILNSLPSRTWNRLGINESTVSIEDTCNSFTPQTDWNNSAVHWLPKAGQAQNWPEMATGMGKDMSSFTQNTPADVIEADPGAQVSDPVLLHYSYQNHEKSVSRLHIHAGKESSVSVILFLESAGRGDDGISAIQTEMYAEEGAQIHLFVIQLLGSHVLCFNDIGGICEKNASIELTKLELGSGKNYSGAMIDLKGRESNFSADVGYHVRENQLLDMNYVTIHHGVKSNSLMEFSGTLEEGAHKAFRGTIDLQKGCQGAKGTENENVLLLGDKMVNQTIPLILCKEEDVEGNHGASIGRLDDKVLFYLGSRGMDEKSAQQLIAHSRIEAICDKIPDEKIRSAVQDFEL